VEEGVSMSEEQNSTDYGLVWVTLATIGFMIIAGFLLTTAINA
jgi:hypothetical protein